MGAIYKITNEVNGKVYIGQSVNPLQRWHRHKQATDKMGICYAIRKYGKENFKFEVIEEVEEKYIDERERYYIQFYDSRDMSKGYNKAIGGKVLRGKFNPMYGYKWSAEQIEAISSKQRGREGKKGNANGMYGKNHTEDAKRAMSEKRKGKNPWNTGKPHPEETRRKISESNKGKVHTEETKAKISQAQIGKKHREESKQKMSEIQTVLHRGRSNITADLITSVIRDYEAGLTYDKLMDKYNIARGSIQRILRGEHWLQKDSVEKLKTISELL